MEHEFKSEYQELRKQCQDFATALLDHTRSSYELEVLLNHDPTGPAFEHGDRMHLNRLKLAIKLRQKKVGQGLRKNVMHLLSLLCIINCNCKYFDLVDLWTWVMSFSYQLKKCPRVYVYFKCE
jgi:hypothetical protein